MNIKITKWIDRNIKTNLKGKNVFITGGNSGIGFELAKECAYLKANVYLLVRNMQKGNEARDLIIEEFPYVNVYLIELDLASFESIRNCVNEVKKHDVDYFINNAGVFRIPHQQTKDGLELVMGTNFVGTFYLNNLLNEYFRSLNHPVMNILTTSVASRLFKINYKNFYLEKGYKNLKIYGLSKAAINDLYYYYLEQYKDSNIKFGLTHPGATYTPLITKGYKNKSIVKAARWFMGLFFHQSDKAALSNLYAIDKFENIFVGPRGMLELSGYPHRVKFKKNTSYLRTIKTGLSSIVKGLENK